MSAASNYDDVLDQLHAVGLIGKGVDDGLRVDTTKPVRCGVEGDREKRGWYWLHSLQTTAGELLIVGSFGVWHGNDQGTQKVLLRKADALTIEQRDALKRRLAEDRKRATVERQREAQRAADRANAAWNKYLPDGESEYLTRKGVAAHGLRFTSGGSAVVPLLDTAGQICGLQFLRTAKQALAAGRPAKEFWPAGLIKKGRFHLVGAPDWLVLVAEGYATAATLHEATGYPVAIAFDAGNLAPVATALKKRYPRTRILICADDDAFTAGNPGVTAASTAALEVGGAWLAPKFADDAARHAKHAANGHKITDFNDLYALEGLHVVRTQVESHLSALKWSAQPRGTSTSDGGGDGRLVPIQTVNQLLERYALVYAHSSAVFDRKEHLLMSVSDMRDACANRYIHRTWSESAERQIVRIREVGFDPAGQDPDITCNLYAGWPTIPKAGSCDRLLDLLRYMCSLDRDSKGLYEWVLRWIAYPIQHPGAKMKSTVVVHGPQGAGKNLFFEAVMKIYGEYGDVLDQSALEDKFNDCFSRKLFMIADEVIARSDIYHIKNKLKSLITGDRIRINPKNFAAYWERNHVNLVFLSNESMPVVLEEDDRRHCVIWTPDKKPVEYYKAVIEEIRAGGIAALHDYLLHLDLGDFEPGAHPPVTEAKAQLITMGLDSPARFYDSLLLEDIAGIEAVNAKTDDWYDLFKIWCQRHGYKAPSMTKFVMALDRQRGVATRRVRYHAGSKTLGPHWFLMLGDAAPANGQPEVAWFGENRGRFLQQFDAWREDR
jgi:putative DNA primase/helicase